MLKKHFSDYITENNREGSGKASSYIRAIDLLEEMISRKPVNFGDCSDLWNITSATRLQDLYTFTKSEQAKKDRSVWAIQGIPKSYLRDGFCSAALKTYQEFLIEFQYENLLLTAFKDHKGSEDELPQKLKTDFQYPKHLLSDLDTLKGKEVVRSVKTRSNQNVFRKMILQIYNNECCITGLNIPEINRASHIIPWSADKDKRLDPRNGLCLSATYDAAFDRNLISLDEDYRIIISKDIKDHYTSQSVDQYFLKKEGQRITMPNSYKPESSYLEVHRMAGNFKRL